jgi:hypothetical protein
MHRLCAILLFSMIFGPTAAAQPEGIPISTWVREDLFAAFLGNDRDRFQAGVKKLDHILARNHDDPGAAAWRASADYYLAVRAHEQGNRAEFERLYKKSMDALLRTYAASPDSIGVLAVTSGITSLFAARLPEPQRTESFKLSRERFEQLAQAQSAMFDKMPAHHRGEVLAGLAQAEQHLGNREKSREYLTRIVSTLAGTPYESPARKWLDDPSAAGTTQLACMSCHEPGRLANVTAQRP